MPEPRPLEIADNFRGVNRVGDQQSISRRELWQAQNFWAPGRGVAETRLGSARFNSSEVSGGVGRNIARYYPSGGTARKIAAFNIAGGDKLYYGTDATGVLSEITGATALSATKQWLFSQFSGNFYAGNATEAIQKSANGTTRADIGGSPAPPVAYPGPVYRSRLTFFGEAANPKRLWYTDTFTENVPADSYIFIEHPEDISAAAVFGRDDDQGVFGDLAIFTPSSTWIIRSDFKDIAGGYSLDRATDRLGCPSPLSLVDTPYGLVGLGYDATGDLVVFMIPVGYGRPVVISDRIRNIETLPRQYRNLANAIFIDGWYRLSFVPSGGTVPNKEWWADLRGYNSNKPDYGVEWWGPMNGRNIGAMMVQSEGSDANELIAVDANAGYVNTLDPAAVWQDFGTAYTAILETKALDGGDPIYMKTMAGFILGAKPTADENVSTRAVVDEGAAAATETVEMEVTAPLVGDGTLVGEETLVGGERFEEYVQYLGSPLLGHRMSVEVTYSGGRQLAVKRVAPIAAKTKRMTR